MHTFQLEKEEIDGKDISSRYKANIRKQIKIKASSQKSEKESDKYLKMG